MNLTHHQPDSTSAGRVRVPNKWYHIVPVECPVHHGAHEDLLNPVSKFEKGILRQVLNVPSGKADPG